MPICRRFSWYNRPRQSGSAYLNPAKFDCRIDGRRERAPLKRAKVGHDDRTHPLDTNHAFGGRRQKFLGCSMPAIPTSSGRRSPLRRSQPKPSTNSGHPQTLCSSEHSPAQLSPRSFGQFVRLF